MRVSIVAPYVCERVARQYHFFTDRGHECQLYIQEQPPGQDSIATTASAAAFPSLEHVRGTALFLFHFIDGPYPLLETMRQLQHGLVILDLCSAPKPEKAPLYPADLCLVADAAQRRNLNGATGYPLERICILPDRQDQILETVMDQATKGIPAQPTEVETKTGRGTTTPAKHELAEDELDATLLLRDPALDRETIIGRVRQAIEYRQSTGGYGPDVITLGPEALRPRPTDDDDADAVDTLLLRLQVAIDDLAVKSQMHEPQFHSDLPLAGPLIVAVRRFWNWMSAKWYMRGWMAQQANFNARVVDVVGELLKLQERNELRIRELESRLERSLNERESPR